MDLSIIIINHNDRENLLRCLNSIYKNTPKIDFETIVIDNNSTNGSISFINNLFKEIRLIENKTNAGFARAANQGIRLANGKYILLLNNDTVVLPCSLNNLQNFMNSRPDALIVGGRVLNPDGSIQFSCREFPNYLTAIFNRQSIFTSLFKNNRFSKNYLMSDWSHDAARQVDWVSACYLIMHRNVIEKLGLMDERFFMYCEDVDLCYRAKQKSFKVYYFPGAEIVHYSGNSKKQDFRKIIWHHQSMYLFYKKHYSRFLVMDILVATAVTLRAVFLLIYNCLR